MVYTCINNNNCLFIIYKKMHLDFVMLNKMKTFLRCEVSSLNKYGINYLITLAKD